MQILLVSATPYEIAPLLPFLEQQFQQNQPGLFQKGDHSITVAITGVGIAATAWHLGHLLATFRPDWAVNAGVAGVFDRSLALGTVVHVIADRFGDTGAETADGAFLDLFDLGLHTPNQAPYINGQLYNPAAGQFNFLPPVHGLTVNKVHGHQPSIDRVRQKYPESQVESMEGAAFFYACLQKSIPFTAIRSISNYVEPRNRDQWQLGRAIESLNQVLLEMLSGVTLPSL